MKNVLLATLCHSSQMTCSHSGSCHNKIFWSPLEAAVLFTVAGRLQGGCPEGTCSFWCWWIRSWRKIGGSTKNLQSLMLIESAADSWGTCSLWFHFQQALMHASRRSGNSFPRASVAVSTDIQDCKFLATGINLFVSIWFIHPASFPYSWISVWFIWFRS